MNDVPLSVFLRIDSPTPTAACDRAAIAHVHPAALSLSVVISQYFFGGMMPDPGSPVQRKTTIIEIRPYRNGWQCFEAPGVQPYWTGESAKDDAIGYAKARAKFGRGEIRVLNQEGSIESIIAFGGPEQ